MRLVQNSTGGNLLPKYKLYSAGNSTAYEAVYCRNLLYHDTKHAAKNGSKNKCSNFSLARAGCSGSLAGRSGPVP
eukprot:2076489-Rhodomonas_salina.2